MYYFYTLRFRKSGKLYKGYTNDLKRRIRDHNSGNSTFTSQNGDFDLVFYEAFICRKDALGAEKYFKSGHGREVLNGKLVNYLSSL